MARTEGLRGDEIDVAASNSLLLLEFARFSVALSLLPPLLWGLKTEHFDDNQVSIAQERMSYYLIAGYVFNLSANTKFKPAALLKAISGAPIIADLSANFLFNDKLTLGVAYRWDDSISGLLGFQVTDGLYLGYSYDATTTELNNYNSGSHEIMLRFELQKVGRILSPRFF